MTSPPAAPATSRTYDLGEALNTKLLVGAVVVVVIGIGGLDLALQHDRPIAVRIVLGVVGGFFVLLGLATPGTVLVRRRSGRRVLLSVGPEGLAFRGPTGPWACGWPDLAAAEVVRFAPINSSTVGGSPLSSVELVLTLRDGTSRQLYLGSGIEPAARGALDALARFRPDLPVRERSSGAVPRYRSGETQQDDTF